MVNAVLWTDPSKSTEIISAASVSAGANSLSSEVTNETAKHQFCSLTLRATFSSAPTVNNVFEAYILYDQAGGAYEDGDATPTDPGKAPACTFPFRAVDTQQTITIPNIPLAPLDFKVLLKSEADQNATGVDLDIASYSPEVQ